MKIIDLLVKIANDEEVPEKIKYNNETFTIREEKDDYANQNCWFTDRFSLLDLNEEVEIIEEDKKIQRLNQDNFQCVSNLEVSGQSANYFEYGIEDEIRDIVDKINEIIDKINKD